MNGNGKKLPGSLAKDARIASWVAIEADGTVTVRTGKVEIGQGIRTAVAMIAAEELDVAMARIRVVSGITGEVVDEGVTSGSGSMEQTGRALRQVTAEARAALMAKAAAHLGVDAATLEVEDGTVRSPATNSQVTYWELQGGQAFVGEATGAVAPKDPASYTLVGKRMVEIDAVAKVTGGAAFIHDLAMDGLVHGRVVRPPSQGAKLLSVDAAAARRLEGVIEVVESGSFLGIVATDEWQAIKARDALALSAQWEESARLPDEDNISAWLIDNESAAHPVIDGTPQDAPVSAIAVPEGAAKTLEASYTRPYHMHASLGPSAAVALFADGRLTVHSPSQGPYPLARALAGSLGLENDAITIIHVQGAGCYGHNGADDVSLDAALLAQAVPGRPVRLQWTRADEHLWEPYGPAMVVMTNASLDNDGKIIDWNLDLWSTTHQGRPRPTTATHSSLLADWYREPVRARPVAKPNFSNESGAHRNAWSTYDLPRQRVVSHFVAKTPLRTSSFRGLGNYANIFAIESFMDELAQAAGIDPLEFRLAHLGDERGRAVLNAAAEAIGWPPGGPGSGTGKGIAFNRYKNAKAYAAVAMEVEVNEENGEIIVKRAVVAGDAGQVVSADGLACQLEGGVIQAISWTLKERVRFGPQRVTSADWESYPILTFTEAPMVECILLNQPGLPYLGAGEGSQGPGGAALANAVFNATGVRLREIPFTPERVKRMMVAAGRGP
ncbi:MAG: xanthine dehydrogenase family protein molybdopterin-binding subunit [Alphaproteobacteria bacterium]|nr:xanthine dehydrogenase family protein molybdopterin-binding subunit [Pseudomonadota bacterium]TDI65569.1 MAG: xanthine dehydrogenase family protein molybdopterin-binding subunit [Alphaproteobacteria bacterium]